MDVMVLKRRLTGVQPLLSHEYAEMTLEEQDHEIALIMGGEMDDDSRDRELRAHTDRIKNLEAELQKARSEAYQAGYQEGQNSTRAEAHKQYTQLAQEFDKDIKAIHMEFTDTLQNLSGPLLKLALSTAEQLIQRELTLDGRANEILLLQIQRILNETVTQTRAVIQVNTSQLDWITGEKILETLNVPQKENLRFIPNPQLKPGECKLETEDYLVNSTIHAQLAALEKVLKEYDAAGID